jgi:hypothetical protein
MAGMQLAAWGLLLALAAQVAAAAPVASGDGSTGRSLLQDLGPQNFLSALADVIRGLPKPEDIRVGRMR